MAIVSELHISAVGMKNIRFFAPPSGRSGLPWVAADDLFSALSMSRRARFGFKHDMRGSPEWRKGISTVTTKNGKVDIIPNWAAQGFISAMEEVAGSPIEVRLAFSSGLIAAFDKLDGHPSNMASFEEALVLDIKEAQKWGVQ